MNTEWNKAKVQEVLDQVEINWEAVSTEWCSCELREDGAYDFHIAPNQICPVCKASIDNDHYHCGICSKVTQVG